ncbi:MAG TPA: tetratricopeptide repeat protein [Vicinamibacterales bacterium]|nr:tetratricopeptide repeat protein [Vicinamibacterales bacterium]
MLTKRLFAALLAVALIAGAAGAAFAQGLVDERTRREALQAFQDGQEFMSAEQFDKAADAFTKAVTSDPLFTLAHYQLGQAYMNLHRYASAIKAFSDCIEAARNVYSLGESSRFDIEKRRTDEITAMRQYIQDLQRSGHALLATAAEAQLNNLEGKRTSLSGEFHPPAEALLSLGSAHFRNGDREQAEAEWRAATEVNPKFGQAWNNLAAAYLQDGRKADAQAAVKAAEKSGYRVNPQMKKDIDAMK